MISRKAFQLSIIASALMLSACGSDKKEEIKDVVDKKIENVLPSATIANISVNELETASLTATAADSDGTISSYLWTQNSGTSVTLTDADKATVSFVAPEVTAHEEIGLSLTVTDNSNGSVTVTGTVMVNNVNKLPSVTIENSQVNEKSTAVITATATDTDGEITTYAWTQTSGTSITLIDAGKATVSFIAPEVSADEEIELSLTVTDNDGGTAVATTTIIIKQLTIPLTIQGLATDSPLGHAEISVTVSGRDITVDVTADENGVYSVDLLLDDTESEAFISIIAKGVAEQVNAGLISLLGTAGQLSTKAGEDNILTQDEHFAVNVTNITTAQYALAKLANNGEDITTDEVLEQLLQSIDYDEVITLATAIKVAIDKAGTNSDLALPSGISDTLALVENTELTQVYIETVKDQPEYQEAQEEIYQDTNLVDVSTWQVPSAYYENKTGLFWNSIYRFYNDNTGSYAQEEFTWQQVDGVITATVTKQEPSTSYDNREINGQMTQVETTYSTLSYTFKRLTSGEKSDVLLVTVNNQVHFPNGELPDEISSSTDTLSMVKTSGLESISHTGSAIAYLPRLDIESGNRADEYILNADGSGHSTIANNDFTWQVNAGVLEFIYPHDNSDATTIYRWSQLPKKNEHLFYAIEVIDDGDLLSENDIVGIGAITTALPPWGDAAGIAGIYAGQKQGDSDDGAFWFELRENGEADTISASDKNEDGVITEDEATIMPGSWLLNSDGSLTVKRVTDENYNYTEDCRYETTPGCILINERTWTLFSHHDDQYQVFRKFDWRPSNRIYYTNRTLYKLDSAPVEIKPIEVPELHFVLDQTSQTHGENVFRFYKNKTGTKGETSFNWTNANGIIEVHTNYSTVSYGGETREINGVMIRVSTESYDEFYQFTPEPPNPNGSNISAYYLETTRVIHFPNGEFYDESSVTGKTVHVVKASKTIAINHTGAGYAYLPFGDDRENIYADEFVLNADGTGQATVNGFDFTWQSNNGVFEITLPNGQEVAKWHQLTNDQGANYYGHEMFISGEVNASDDYLGLGAILTTLPEWDSNNLAGIYSPIQDAVGHDGQSFYWYEFSANGDVNTYWLYDANNDYVFSKSELYTEFGNWRIDSDGVLIITLVSTVTGDASESCREVIANTCLLTKEVTLRLLGEKDNQLEVFQRYFQKSTHQDVEDSLSYENRPLFKLDQAPVDIMNLPD
ncbi:hypothetical protein CMT41_00585 [Colwellia sp. MT41]|uniref:PKD domain-containing protein n=1 Tax=Colwellia sp. MT41 TaxID=58049 RepID=UPI000717563C|nr:hypothetical protein [Colwellia sp. MT41]ALO33372.1 hypothetical protein CMT41_00585 [Colwellia sp. MT41]